ncbi:MAG: type VI secretion system contractile sheath small subunit [Rhodothermia bacterium]|nr:MAG: type VI secretion system contractile sheath small subunit [Rhodothermia bacterium]
MAKSFQHEKPPARINLFLEVQKGDAKKKVELPLRLMVTGDFSGKESDVPVEDREIINLNKDNFEKVMKSQDLGLEYTVDNKLTGEGEISVELNIENMADFSPEEIAKQVPGLSRLLAARNLLQDLRNRLISVRDFRQQLESVITDEAAREELLAELEKVVPSVRTTDEETGE